MKVYLRSAVLRLSQLAGLLSWRQARMRGGLTILMYHRILPWEQCTRYPLASLVLPDYAFREQMQWLSAKFQVKPVHEAISVLRDGQFSDAPLVSVTFDDGYSDNFAYAAPILDECGLRGTFFVTTGFVADGTPQWYDRAAVAWTGLDHAGRSKSMRAVKEALDHSARRVSLPVDIRAWMAALKVLGSTERRALVDYAASLSDQELDLSAYSPMRPRDVKALHESGHEIASHTISHPILPELSDAALVSEIEGSAGQLRSWTGAPVTGFCYPNGDYDDRVENAVVKAGYGYACTIHEGINVAETVLTRLNRVPVTMHRTMHGPVHDPLAFRSEACRLRAVWLG